MKVPEYLAGELRKRGVERFFGIPGGPSIPYMKAFSDAGIDFVLTSHEAPAAIMADVTSRITGIPGICHGTFGPGAVNLASGVGTALLDRSAVIALTTEVSDSWMGRTTQMHIDHQSLFRPLTKATFRLSAENAGDVVRHALDLATCEYPGPVHIGLPADLASSVAGEVGAAPHVPDSPVSAVNNFEKIKVLTAAARRPLLAVGLTAFRAGLGRDLLKFLEGCPVPVVVTPMAKGLIDPDHPCFAGVLFHALSDRLRQLTSRADLIIGLGYDPVEYNYESWVEKTPVISFDTVNPDRGLPGSINHTSPPEEWFGMLDMLRGSEEMTGLAAAARREITDTLAGAWNGFTPVTVLGILREMLPQDTTVTADVGSHLHLLGQMWNNGHDGRLIMTNGWSSMGFGLPAAIAAALADRGRNTVCITGDGGMMMYPGEIMTARRLGLKIITVVIADAELNLIRLKQSWKGLNPYGTSLYSGTLFGSNSFLGTEVLRVNDRESFAKAVKKALGADHSVIIEAAVSGDAYGSLVVRT